MPDATSAPESRVIRVFLSSTFRDFMQERDRLVKEVFPELRRKARDRGVEVVEVDLRWGITEEESRQGKVLPICLAEIQRCRPYFVGMLGERYGWVPPDDDDNRVVLADQAWVEEHLGRRSVTELEILHGVLNNPEMAGRAFFYFRDPAWSQAQSEPGFVCDSDEEAEKLTDLKQRILASSFPVVQERDLPNPKALADRIGADLWALIEEQFPELDQPDALEQEERKHASYRRSRTELYEDGGSGGGKVSQLGKWITAGEERILITGDSGAGKSALIANWMQRHQQQHPGDVVFAHHLGCSNDANALEPMLARMVQTASKLMADELSEPIKVPQDYWELVSTVNDTLSKLSYWCKQQGRRWIWVLDGLDRLPEENQQALPWLPLQLFPHLHVVISALDCAARTILQDREYTTLTIAPLERDEQKALIANYMWRYNKTLVPELEAKILEHEPARSPLFLRVVLDELRVCGRHETLAHQLDNYLKAKSVDALYAKVLERLEGDVGRKPVQKVMQALWSSRAGLSEPELQAITGVAPLQWAPIDLGLEGSFGRNGNRLVFDHDYLRKAVEDLYLPTNALRQKAHHELADWFGRNEEWDTRKAEELPWHLQEGGRIHDLRALLLRVSDLYELARKRDPREVINYWRLARREVDGELDELIAKAVDEELAKRKHDPIDQIRFADRIAGLLHEAGLFRNLLLRMRTLSLELEEATEDGRKASVLVSLAWLASTHRDMGHLDEAERLYRRCLEGREQFLGTEHLETLGTINNLGVIYIEMGCHEKADSYLSRCLEGYAKLLGSDHPDTSGIYLNLGLLYSSKGDHKKAVAFYAQCLERRKRLLGFHHPDTLAIMHNLGSLYIDMCDYGEAEACLRLCLDGRERLLGPEHPETLNTAKTLGAVYESYGKYEEAKSLLRRCFDTSWRLLGPDHPTTLGASNDLGNLYCATGCYKEAEELYSLSLEAQRRLLGHEHLDTLKSLNNLGLVYIEIGKYDNASASFSHCLKAFESLLGPEHPDTLMIVNNLGLLYSSLGDYVQAKAFCKRALAAEERLLGPEHRRTLSSMHALGAIYSKLCEYDKAEACYTRCLDARERLLGLDHIDTIELIGSLGRLYKLKGNISQAERFLKLCLESQERVLGNENPEANPTRHFLANLYSDEGRYCESIPLRRQEIFVEANKLGRNAPSTLFSIKLLADDLYWSDELEEAEQLYREALAGLMAIHGDDDGATMTSRYGLACCLSAKERFREAIELRRIELGWCRREYGDLDQGTLSSIDCLATDLLKSGAVAEAEVLFKERVSGNQKVLNADNILVGHALSMLAKTLEEACKLDEAATYGQQALDHRQTHEGPDAWCTNRERLDLARVLQKLGRNTEAKALLQGLMASINRNNDPDDADRQLISDAKELMRQIEEASSEKS